MSQFIIIANGKTEELMAKRIHAIISQDERFEALCWTEKQYKASAQTISSSQNCLFIGETSEYKANNFGDGIKWKYDQYGMKYGWIGRKGFLVVDKKEKLSAEQKEELAQKFSKFFDDVKKGAKQIEEKTQTEANGEKSNFIKKLFNKKKYDNGWRDNWRNIAVRSSYNRFSSRIADWWRAWWNVRRVRPRKIHKRKCEFTQIQRIPIRLSCK